jgi:two-component system, OmpR family, sensor histidine kinase VicK
MSGPTLPPEQYRLLVESSPVMIWRAGLDAKCDYFNETWLAFTGRSFEQEYGDGWAEGVHPEDLDRCVGIYRDHFARHAIFEMEYRLMRYDGVYRWIFDRGVPFTDAAGQFGGFIGSCVDVDERVRAQALLENAAARDRAAAEGLAAELVAQGQQVERAAPGAPRAAAPAPALPASPAALARDKLSRVFGAERAEGLFERLLGEMGMGDLRTMADLDQFAKGLRARGGVEGAVGAALSTHMLLQRFQQFR